MDIEFPGLHLHFKSVICAFLIFNFWPGKCSATHKNNGFHLIMMDKQMDKLMMFNKVN